VHFIDASVVFSEGNRWGIVRCPTAPSSPRSPSELTSHSFPPHVFRAAKSHAHSSQGNGSPTFTSLIKRPPRALNLIANRADACAPIDVQDLLQRVPSTPLPSSSEVMPSILSTCPSPNPDASSSAQKGLHLLTAGASDAFVCVGQCDGHSKHPDSERHHRSPCLSAAAVSP
jgi:hypothetical protein